MVGSKYCVLSSQKNRKKGQECKYDYGGYFIVLGNEKVIIPQEKMWKIKVYFSYYKITE